MCPSRTFSNYANSDDRWLRVTRFRDTKARYIHNGAISRRDGYRTQGECGTCFRKISAEYGLASSRRDEAAGKREESRNRAPEQHHRAGERMRCRRKNKGARCVHVYGLFIFGEGPAQREREFYAAVQIRVVETRRREGCRFTPESLHPPPFFRPRAVPVGQGV